MAVTNSVIWLLTLLTCQCVALDKIDILSQRYEEALQRSCPLVNVCNSKSTSEAAMSRMRFNMIPCCTECSCSDDCKKDNNCCFPENNIEDNNIECVFPSTKEPPTNEVGMYDLYRMVSSVPGNENCGEETDAPWGALWPIYSKRTGKIYKNSVCSSANSVGDGIRWDAIVTCTSLHKKLDNMDIIESLTVTNACRVDFIYPNKSSDLNTEICHKHMIETCPNTGVFFNVPDSMSLTINETRMACESGLVSPVRLNEKLYANIFCYACNGGVLYRNMMCQSAPELSSKTSLGDNFSVLLNTAALEARNKHKVTKTRFTPVACMEYNNSLDLTRCRNVHCSKGRLRDSEGSCKLLMTHVYGQTVHIDIKLTTDHVIDINQVFDLPSKLTMHDIQTTDLSPLASPWPKAWKINRAYYNHESLSKHPMELLVSLHFTQNIISLKYIIQQVEQYLDMPWFFNHNSTQIPLQPQLMDSNFYITNTNENSSTTITISNETTRIQFPTFTMFFMEDIFASTVDVTNTLFCDQVELHRSEYELSADETMLFNKLTGKMVFKTDFYIRSDVYGQTYARLCIQHSGVRQMMHYNTGTHVTPLPFSCTIQFVFIWYFCFVLF